MQLDLTCFQHSDTVLQGPEAGVQGGGVFRPFAVRLFGCPSMFFGSSEVHFDGREGVC